MDNKQKIATRSPGIARPQSLILRAFEVLAALASHPDLSGVTGATRDHLLVDAWNLIEFHLSDAAAGASGTAAKTWDALCRFHPKLRETLGALTDRPRLDGDRVVGGDARLRIDLSLDLPLDSAVLEVLDRVGVFFDDPPAQLVQLLGAALVVALFSSPFPLRDCAYCRRIFVRGSAVRRLFCSRECATRHAERMRRVSAVVEQPNPKSGKRRRPRKEGPNA